MVAAETGLAAALLVPVVPARVGGVGLSLFGAGLVGTYLRAPGLRRKGSVRPTEMGLGVAKDIWMVATGIALIAGDGKH
jgi:hypothetical protein